MTNIVGAEIVYNLCLSIEQLPASEQQTALSIEANAVLKAFTNKIEVLSAVRKALKILVAEASELRTENERLRRELKQWLKEIDDERVRMIEALDSAPPTPEQWEEIRQAARAIKARLAQEKP